MLKKQERLRLFVATTFVLLCLWDISLYFHHFFTDRAVAHFDNVNVFVVAMTLLYFNKAEIQFYDC